MSYRRTEIWKSIDWFTVILYVLMVVAGWFSICGASYEFDNVGLFDIAGRPGSQLMWMGLSVGIIFVILMLESDFFDVFAYLIYAVVILLLIATIFLAPNIKGSHSWLVLGPIRLQPAEFAKFATALAVAKLMNIYGFKLTAPKNFLVVLVLIFLPMVCILLQKETGSALVYLAFFLMLYREGMSGYILLAGVCAVVFFVTEMKYSEIILGITSMGEFIVSNIILAITMVLVYLERKDNKAVFIMLIGIATAYVAGYITSLFIPVDFALIAEGLVLLSVLYLIYLSARNWVWHYILIGFFALASLAFLFSVDYVFNNVLEPHQQIRIKVSLGLEDDPSGAGYNVNQSKIAIGSGGLTGKGFLNGTQTKLKYVPEQDTDFIFCTVGEEQGFVGATAVLILFGIFIIRLIMLAERQGNTFRRVYGYSVASIFFFHLAINVGMVTGLTPVIGIPLPFFSYGGSSLWGFTILLFIFLRLDASRNDR
ncbi:rod shape-determining protein RodA [Parabacteroides bouchesdurhonensis]|uniref:rod shape-determining protein RodA n=1 Tax=Parabacteroides bouchesdurhonensis TaxID=1936995 RepID=UPI000E4CBD2A|nr:rod shape-determining protein RodA [Parabacteroides bouchesdurhonensis]RHJ92478.1 rod shape-determining protein RodA [Bacteroides sp. AM07-16]